MIAAVAAAAGWTLAAGALAYTLTAHRRYRLQRIASSALRSSVYANRQTLAPFVAIRGHQ